MWNKTLHLVCNQKALHHCAARSLPMSHDRFTCTVMKPCKKSSLNIPLLWRYQELSFSTNSHSYTVRREFRGVTHSQALLILCGIPLSPSSHPLMTSPCPSRNMNGFLWVMLESKIFRLWARRPVYFTKTCNNDSMLFHSINSLTQTHMSPSIHTMHNSYVTTCTCNAGDQTTFHLCTRFHSLPRTKT